MTIHEMPMPKDQAIDFIRNASKDTSKIIIPDLNNAGAWQSVVHLRQVLKCLEDGNLLSEPALDDHDNWACTLQRYGGGINVIVDVVIIGDGPTRKLVITQVRKQVK